MRAPAARAPGARRSSGDAGGHRPRKRFGQNFLHDPAVVDRIVAAIAPGPEDSLLEIGPGLGVLTAPLLERCRRLHAVEIDRDLAAALRARFEHRRTFHLHEGDALEFSLASVDPGHGLRVVGNLPYNISTPLLFHLLEQREHVLDMHFMLQREVVRRLEAGPGSKTYGRLSVMVQLDCEVQALFDVGPGAFRPAPKVTSALVRLRPRARPAAPVDDRACFARVVQRLFSQRRKTLRAGLKGQLSAASIEALGIDPGARPERLDVGALARLANAIHSAAGDAGR